MELMKKTDVDNPGSIFEPLEPRILLSGTPAPDLVTEYFSHAEVFVEQAPEENQISEILFIDSGVDNYETLLKDFNYNVEVLMIPEGEDGIDFITSALGKREGIDAVHIFSHGNEQEIFLGNSSLNKNSISSYESQLSQWGEALNEGADILIYGCNFGQSTELLTQISELTQADIAASDDLTGSEHLGGDAELEVEVGNITVNEFFSQSEFNDADIVLLDAVDDDYTSSDPTDENTALNINAGGGLLANDDGTNANILESNITSANGAQVTINADGSFTYDPTTSTTLQALDEGQTIVDTFDYTLADSGTAPDGLMNVQYINTSGTNPGNNSDNWESLWDVVAGTNTTGDVVTTTGTYNIVNNNSDTETLFDYNTGGDFGVNRGTDSINSDGSGGGGATVASDNYSIRVNTFLKFQHAGTYTIAMGSDDGRRIELKEASGGSAPGYTGFTSRGDQNNGSFTSGDTVIGFSGSTGHQQTVGTFTVAAGDILELTAFYYEASGGDSGEISIANGTFSSFTNTGDFTLLQSGVEGVLLGSSFAEVNQVLTTETATVSITVNGINDAPIARDDSKSITELVDDTTTPNDTSGNFFTDGTDDSDVDDSKTTFSITQITNAISGTDTTGSIVGKYGTLTWVPNTQGTGSYTYTLDDSNTDVQALNAGNKLTEVFTYTLSDNHSGGNVKTDSATLTITINGANDTLLAEDNSASVTEDSGAGQVASGNLITDDDSLDTNHADGVTVDVDVDAVDLAISEISNATSGTDTSGTIAGEYGTLVWDKDTGAYTYTLANGTDGVSSAVQNLKAGEQVTDTFTYKLHNGVVSGDGLMNIQYIDTSGSIPGNNTANWLSLWDEVAGTNTTGNVVTSTGTYNIVNNNSDTETVFDYDSGGNFGTNNNLDTINSDGPGGGGATAVDTNLSIRVNTFLAFNAGGTYTIAMGSDDGRRIELKEAASGSAPGYTGFTSRGDQNNGSFTSGDTVIGFSGGTGHNQTVGTFTVEAGDVLELTAFYYQGGGGHSGEISIAQGEFSNFTNTTDFKLITDEQFDIALSSANNFQLAADGYSETETDTATLTVTVTGTNDAPVIESTSVINVSDISGWTSDSNKPTGVNTANPVWNITGNSVTQTVNSHPAVLESDFEIASTQYSGEFNIVSNSGSDDDAFGFVLGYNDDGVNTSENGFILIDWNRKGDNHNVMGLKSAGMAASFVQGTDIEGANFWGHTGDVTEVARANNLGSTGFTLGVSANFKFTVNGDNLKIFVDDVLEFDLDAADFGLTDFPIGSFGFYNFAQENTTYEMVSLNVSGDPAVSFAEGDSPVVLAPSMSLTDIDSNFNTGKLTVQITGNNAGAEDVLNTALNFSAFATLDGASTDQKLIFNLNASADATNVKSLMESITYENTSERPSTLDRTITFTMEDSEGATDTETIDVLVTAVNDAPVLSIATNNFSVDEEATVSITGVSLADADSGSDDVQLTLSVDNGTLIINNPNSGPVSGANLVITGTISELNTALAGLTYTPTSDYSGSDTISLEIDDLGNHEGFALKDSGTISIDVDPVTDAVVPTNLNTDEDTSVNFSITSTDGDEGMEEILFTDVNGTITGTGVTDLGGGQFKWEKPIPVNPTFDLNTFVMNSHSDQDTDPADFTVSADGTSIELTGNTWKNIDINYTVTANTVLEFEMKSDVEPEISMILFDNDNLFSSGNGAEYFVMHGVQNFNDSAGGIFKTYDGSGNFVKFKIHVGEFFTGDFSKLVFANDDDRSGAPGDTTYKNVKLYEDTLVASADFTYTPAQDLEFDTFVNATVQTRDGGELISSGVQRVDIGINPVNDNPVISLSGGDKDSETFIETDSGLTVAGTLTVVDVDLADVVDFSAFSVTASGTTAGSGLSNADLLSMMNVSGSIDNVSTSSTLNWSFDSGTEAFNYLANGESLVLTYTIQALDDSGINSSFDTHDVVITITGTNDQPLATNSSILITEDSSFFARKLNASSVEQDSSQNIKVENLKLAVSGPADEDVVFELDGNGVLSLDPFQFNYMKEGEVVTLVFTYDIVDDSGVGAGNANDEAERQTDVFTLIVNGKKESPPGQVTVLEPATVSSFSEEAVIDTVQNSEKVSADKIESEVEKKSSLSFVAKSSSVNFEKSFLSEDSLGVIEPIFNQNPQLESEVSSLNEENISVKESSAYDKSLLPQAELQFIEDLKEKSLKIVEPAPPEVEEEGDEEDEKKLLEETVILFSKKKIK